MEAPRWERFAGACGVLFVVFFLAGQAMQDTGVLHPAVSAAELTAHFTRSDTELRREVGATMIGFAIFFLLIFIGSLYSALERAVGGRGVFSSAAFAGGIAMALFFGASAALETAVVSAAGFYNNFDVDANTVLAFSTLSLWSLGLAMVGGSVLIGSSSLIAWKTGLFPKWLSIAGFVVAVLGFFGETTAAFFAPVILTAVWVLVVSAILTRRRAASDA